MPANSANIVQSDGSTAVTETSTVNEGGAVRHAGNVPSDRNITSKSLGTLANATDTVGSVVASGTNITRSVNGDNPTFGMNLGDAQIRMAGNVNYDAGTRNRNSFTVAGESVTAMRGGASDFGTRRRVHKMEAIRTFHRTEAIRDGLWNEFGIAGQRDQWESAPSTSTSGVWDPAANSAAADGDDHAASGPEGNIGQPDKVPGELTVHSGALGKPTNLDYKAKHGTTS
jgi:hypothetical protein